MAQKKQNKADGVIPSSISLEEILASRTEDEILRDKLVTIAQRQIQTSMKHKRVRMDEVQKSIDLYNGVTKKALKGRWNIPLPLMSGYVDTLLSKTDDPPKVKFGHQDIADMRRAAKVQAKWEQDSTSVESRWNEKDRQGKKIASFYGYCVTKYFAFNDASGTYRSHLEIVDPLDFEFEPMGGQNLRDHKFMGQRNIFKTKADLVSMSTGAHPIYDKKQVLRLLTAVNSNDYKSFQKVYSEKIDRMRSLGWNPELNAYIGVPTFNMTEWYMEYEGIWYYLFMEAAAGICVRFCRLSELFPSAETPFDAWHTHPDAFNFLSKAPADDMRPIAEGMNIIFNQALDNREKKNYGQRAYDPAVFPDPAELEWRQDGLVATTEGISSSQSIGQGIYQFTIADMPEAGTINLMKFMDDLTGLKTGITAGAQGETDDKRVGIYFGNMQQVADRLGLYNKSYSECWGRVGRKYYFGLRDHIKTNKMMVRMIGAQGYDWEELVADDLDPVQEFNITIVGGQSQAQIDEITKKNRKDTLTVLIASPLVNRMNPNATIEEYLRAGAFEDDQIKRLMDTQNYGSEEEISKANQDIETILMGGTVKKNRSASTVYIQTIIDFAYDSDDLSLEDYNKLIEFAQSHMQIAMQNAVRKVRMMQSMAAINMATSGQNGGNAGDSALPGKDTGAAPSVADRTQLTPAGAKSAVVNNPQLNS